MQGPVETLPFELPRVISEVQILFGDRALDPEIMEEKCLTVFDKHHMVTMYAGP